MKKLMIAAAIVCAAVAANAANFMWGNDSYSIDNWNGNQPKNPDLEAPMYEGGKMFLYLGTISYTDGVGFDYTDGVGFDLASATLLASSTYNGDEYLYGKMADYATGDVDTSVGASQDFTMVLVNNDSYADLTAVKDGDMFVLRTGESITDYDGSIEARFAMFEDATPIQQSDWTKYSSVPEPTSGLLLLLGVAGLALRRRA